MDTAARISQNEAQRYRIGVNDYAHPDFFKAPALKNYLNQVSVSIAESYRKACQMLYEMPAGAVHALVKGDLQLERDGGELVVIYPQDDERNPSRVVPFRGDSVDRDKPDRFVVNAADSDITPVAKLKHARQLFRQGYVAAAYASVCELVADGPAGAVPMLVESRFPAVEDLCTPDGAFEFFYKTGDVDQPTTS